jgi:hypothetical protein
MAVHRSVAQGLGIELAVIGADNGSILKLARKHTGRIPDHHVIDLCVSQSISFHHWHDCPQNVIVSMTVASSGVRL